MSITGRERRTRRRTTVIVVDREPAAIPPAIAAQQRKASEPRVDKLEEEVDTKAPLAHTHAQADVTGLVAALAGKLDTTTRLNGLVDPNGSVQFAQQQALQFRVENRTSDPATPAVGEIWLRTDL